MLTHIVLFKMKDRRNSFIVRDKLLSLNGKIPQLKMIEVGLDVLHSDRSYDVALYTKFDSMETMQEYQEHPAHLEVSKYISTVRESSVSVDFEG